MALAEVRVSCKHTAKTSRSLTASSMHATLPVPTRPGWASPLALRPEGGLSNSERTLNVTTLT
eukprot:7278516-Alexandrium_andersonii.AAC.1